MHQCPSEFPSWSISFVLLLGHKAQFSPMLTFNTKNLTHNSFYRWRLKYFQAYDQKWHQTLESALLTSLYANFSGGNVYVFRVHV